MGGIFICYRREDTAGWAGRLQADLQTGLKNVRIFRDIDAIPPGVKFDKYIADALGTCDVLIAMIGPRWLTAVDAQGTPRLHDPNDLIRLEIATCLRRDICVIPALLGDARLPNAHELPEDIRELTGRQAYELSDNRWSGDCQNLIGVLSALTGLRPTPRRKITAIAAAVLVVALGAVGLWQWQHPTISTQMPGRVTATDTSHTSQTALNSDGCYYLFIAPFMTMIDDGGILHVRSGELQFDHSRIGFDQSTESYKENDPNNQHPFIVVWKNYDPGSYYAAMFFQVPHENAEYAPAWWGNIELSTSSSNYRLVYPGGNGAIHHGNDLYPNNPSLSAVPISDNEVARFVSNYKMPRPTCANVQPGITFLKSQRTPS